MAMLHEILAVEKTKTDAANALLKDTENKFGKDHYFYGHVKTLKMLTASPEAEAMELAAKESRELPTTVYDTLEYALGIWSEAEDVIYQKNVSNTKALADIELDGTIVAAGVPVDELMGLENRLDKLRSVLMLIPTLEASMKWSPAPERGAHVWVNENVQTASKTEKRMVPVVLYDATKEHPAIVTECRYHIATNRYREVLGFSDWPGPINRKPVLAVNAAGSNPAAPASVQRSVLRRGVAQG